MKDLKERLKQLRIIKVHEEFYLGVIKKDEIKDDILTDAISCGEGFDEDDINRWFRAFNVDNIYEEIKLAGPLGYTVRSFNVHENRHAQHCLVIMEDAKRLALRQVENDHFSKAMKEKV